MEYLYFEKYMSNLSLEVLLHQLLMKLLLLLLLLFIFVNKYLMMKFLLSWKLGQPLSFFFFFCFFFHLYWMVRDFLISWTIFLQNIPRYTYYFFSSDIYIYIYNMFPYFIRKKISLDFYLNCYYTNYWWSFYYYLFLSINI